MKCTNCGAELKEGAVICDNCGMLLSAPKKDDGIVDIYSNDGSVKPNEEFDEILFGDKTPTPIPTVEEDEQLAEVIDSSTPETIEDTKTEDDSFAAATRIANGVDEQPIPSAPKAPETEKVPTAKPVKKAPDKIQPPKKAAKKEQPKAEEPKKSKPAPEKKKPSKPAEPPVDDSDDFMSEPKKKNKGAVISAIVVVLVVALASGAYTMKNGDFDIKSLLGGTKDTSVSVSDTDTKNPSTDNVSKDDSTKKTTEDDKSTEAPVSDKTEATSESSKRTTNTTEKTITENGKTTKSDSSASTTAKHTTEKSTVAKTTAKHTTQNTTAAKTTAKHTTQSTTVAKTTTKHTTQSTTAAKTTAKHTTQSTTAAKTTAKQTTQKTTAKPTEPATKPVQQTPAIIKALGLPNVPDKVTQPKTYSKTAYLAYITDEEGVKLRVKPSTKADSTASLRFGREIQVLAKQDGWLFVFTAYNRQYGWVKEIYTDTESPVAEKIIINPGTLQPDVKYDEPKDATVSVDTYLFMRKGPSQDYDKFTSMFNDSKLIIIGEMKDTDGWYYVRQLSTGIEGWASAEYITIK